MQISNSTKNLSASAAFIAGILVLASQPAQITGAFIGAGPSTGSLISSFIGTLLIVSSLLILTTIGSELERKVNLSSSIKKHPGLLRLTEDAVKNQAVERDLNHLISELGKGNFEAGLGHPGHIDKTNIFYLRGRNGGRLFYHQIGSDSYEIVAKSSKANEDKVRKTLVELYTKSSKYQ